MPSDSDPGDLMTALCLLALAAQRDRDLHDACKTVDDSQ